MRHPPLGRDISGRGCGIHDPARAARPSRASDDWKEAPARQRRGRRGLRGRCRDDRRHTCARPRRARLGDLRPRRLPDGGSARARLAHDAPLDVVADEPAPSRAEPRRRPRRLGGASARGGGLGPAGPPRPPTPTPPPLAPRWAPPASPPATIGFLGALDVTKGVHVLLDAAPRLVELGYTLRIAGDGRLRPFVEDAAARLPGVAYAGWVPAAERVAFLGACDLGVVPSVWDEPGGPPLALLDWLSAGRPVLSSGRGGLSELQGARGVIEVEPTADALVRAAAALRDPHVWDELRADVRPPALPS